MSMKKETSGRRFVPVAAEDSIPLAPVGTRSTASQNFCLGDGRGGTRPYQDKYLRVLLIGVALLLLLPSARAQVMPTPGKEHDFLKQLVGTWDAESESGKGTMTYTMGLGGLWLIGDFDGEFAGIKFEGKFLDTYDSPTKKYRSIEVSSFTTGARIMEGTLNNKVMTMTGEGPGHDGKMGGKFKSITEFKDADTVNFTLFMADKDGKEQPVVKITYKRKK